MVRPVSEPSGQRAALDGDGKLPAVVGLAGALLLAVLALGSLAFGSRPSVALGAALVAVVAARLLVAGRTVPAGGFGLAAAAVLGATLAAVAGLGAAHLLPSVPEDSALEELFDGSLAPALDRPSSFLVALLPAYPQDRTRHEADQLLVVVPAEGPVPQLQVHWWLEQVAGGHRTKVAVFDLDASDVAQRRVLPSGVLLDSFTEAEQPGCWRLRVTVDAGPDIGPRGLSVRLPCR